MVIGKPGLRSTLSPRCDLASLRPGDRAVVVGMDGANGLNGSNGGNGFGRLGEFGVVAGAGVRLVRRAPLGDPIELDVAGTRLVVRTATARKVWVERCAR